MTNNKYPRRSGRGRTSAENADVQSHSTTIFVGNQIVGCVEGKIFHKSINGSIHMLQRSPAIAFDVESISQAKKAGALHIKVIDKDDGTIYETSIQHLRERCIEFNRSYGDQIYLVLEEWNRIPLINIFQPPPFGEQYG